MKERANKVLRIAAVIVAVMIIGFLATCQWFIKKGKETMLENQQKEDVVATATEAADLEMADATAESDKSDKNAKPVKTNGKVAQTSVTAGNKTTKTDKPDNTQAPATTESENTAPATTERQRTTETERTTDTQAPATEAPATTETHVCQHNWVTIIDSEAYDEPVYEEQVIIERVDAWRDGTVCDHCWNSCERQRWCMRHCTTCNPDCPDPDPRGFCAFYDMGAVYSEHTETVQVGTTHHDAVTHQECSICGARK